MAVKLNGSSFLGLAQRLVGSFPCSIQFWCSTDQNGIQQLPFNQSQASADRYMGYFFESNGAGGYGVYRQQGGTGGGLQGFTGGLASTLRHYVMVLNSLTQCTLYVNNSTPVTGSTFSITNGDILNHDTITIGGNRINGAGLASALNGSIAECAIFNVALTATDVTNLRTGASKPEDIAGCIACFPLTTATDLTSTNGAYTLTPSGTVVTSSLAHPITRSAGSPTINTQPSNQTVVAGATATFTVAATASAGSLTYQWQRNGTNISGATSASYTTPATTVTGGSANNGDTYRCVVGDSNGSTTSSSATLTVNAAASAKSGINFFYRKGNGNV